VAPTASATPSPTAKLRQMLGTVALKQVVRQQSNGDCAGTGGYSDIVGGATVTVYDQAGTIVGADILTAGQIDYNHASKSSSGAILGYCTFKMSVVRLPERPFYQVEVAHRGKITVQPADLLKVDLTLG